MSFWDGVKDFASVTQEMFMAKENTTRSFSDAATNLLDTVQKSAQRTYINSGFMDSYRTKPNVRNVVAQTPELILLVKKRMFSSLQENYPMDKMDKDERHFMRASKKLFQNKCKELAAYEALTKLQKTVQKTGVLNTALASMIMDFVDSTENLFVSAAAVTGGAYDLGLTSTLPDNRVANNLFESQGIKKFSAILEKLRQVLAYNGFSTNTQWVSNGKNSGLFDASGFGSGVIELTLVSAFNSTTSLSFGGGSASFTVQDPCRICFIDDADIERAMYETSPTGFAITSVLSENLKIQIDAATQNLNNSRRERGASTVTYKVNPYAKIYNRVTVILDNYGTELTKKDGQGIDYDILHNKALFGIMIFGQTDRNTADIINIEEFTQSEEKLLSTIYDNTFKLLSFQSLDMKNFYEYNTGTNYVRRTMRQNYMGKQIIQPMDIVSAFISSQAVDDNQVLSGIRQSFSDFSSGVNAKFGNKDILGLINKTTGALKDNWTAIFGKKGKSTIEIEKNMLAGSEFPMYLYLGLRDYFTCNEYGNCVFSGVVDTVKEQYRDGSYSLNVSCKDNTFYFEQGLISTMPSLGQFNGHLYDPTTPFDLETDSSSGQLLIDQFKLLNENEALLRSGILKYQDGKYIGQNITSDNYQKTDFSEFNSLSANSSQASNSSPSALAGGVGTISLVRRVFHNPDGFVYRWKRGVATAWVNQANSSVGSSFLDVNNQNNIANVVKQDAFAGQDLVNIISMLICGEPYNFSTFVQAALGSGGIARDQYNNLNSGYFNDIFKLINKQNKIWGNFIPFKRLNLDGTMFNQLFNSQTTILAQSSVIQGLQTERAKLMDQIIKIDSGFANNLGTLSAPQYIDNVSVADNVDRLNRLKANTEITTSNIIMTTGLIRRIIALDCQIQIAQQTMQESLADGWQAKGLKIFGSNGVILGVENQDVAGSNVRSDDFTQNISRRQNALTQRKLWQVKANIDNNLFIVCDEYDQDYDLQGIALTFADPKTFDSSWQSTGAKINTMAKVMGMEIFANSQGHIELRVPQYNRMPSSLFYDMLRRNREYGIKIYPEYLESSFIKRAEDIFKNLEILEDKIRLYTTMLGNTTDDDRCDYLSGANIFADDSDGNQFFFLTDEATGSLTGIRTAVKAINNDYKQADNPTNLVDAVAATRIDNTDIGDFFERNSDVDRLSVSLIGTNIAPNTVIRQVGNLKKTINSYNNFDAVKQKTSLETVYKNIYSVTVESLMSHYADAFNMIKGRLASKTGTTMDDIQLNFSHSVDFISPIDINAINIKLGGLVSERYKEILTIANIIKNIDSGARANSADMGAVRGLLLPNLFPSKEIPDFMRHMIEDESDDDFGYDSGSRYVIKEKDVISTSYYEQGPEFTAIDVKGSAGEQNGSAGLIGGEQGFKVGDMEMARVFAVDYDLWRMYGYKSGPNNYLPFLNNPETQLAPFAMFLLNQQRAKILHAQITCRGNEFYQAGEVYYLEERGMLFYIDSVQQNFTYGGKYETVLNCSYGHCPGEYIPTTLDIIGKSLYKGYKNSVNNYIMTKPKSASEATEGALGAIVVDMKKLIQQSVPIEDVIFNGPYGERNKETLTNILYKAQMALNSPIATYNNTKVAVISVRIFKNNGKFSKVDPDGTNIKNVAYEIIKFLKTPVYSSENKSDTKKENLSSYGIPANKIVGGASPDVFTINSIREVELDSKAKDVPSNTNFIKELRGPSSFASQIATQLAGNKGIVDTFDEEGLKTISGQIKDSLLKNTIDVWIEFVPPSTDILTTKSTDTSKKETTKPTIIQNMQAYYDIVVANINTQNQGELITIVPKAQQ